MNVIMALYGVKLAMVGGPGLELEIGNWELEIGKWNMIMVI